MSHSQTSGARLDRAQRAVQALELRKRGLTYREIATRMGVSEQRAHQIVRDELARLNAQRSETAAEIVRVELERLDTLLAAVWKKAQKGDKDAITAALKIMERRAKLLGLDVEKAPPTVAGNNVVVLSVTEVVTTHRPEPAKPERLPSCGPHAPERIESHACSLDNLTDPPAPGPKSLSGHESDL